MAPRPLPDAVACGCPSRAPSRRNPPWVYDRTLCTHDSLNHDSRMARTVIFESFPCAIVIGWPLRRQPHFSATYGNERSSRASAHVFRRRLRRDEPGHPDYRERSCTSARGKLSRYRWPRDDRGQVRRHRVLRRGLTSKFATANSPAVESPR
jgi:hypothetical protein